MRRGRAALEEPGSTEQEGPGADGSDDRARGCASSDEGQQLRILHRRAHVGAGTTWHDEGIHQGAIVEVVGRTHTQAAARHDLCRGPDRHDIDVGVAGSIACAAEDLVWAGEVEHFDIVEEQDPDERTAVSQCHRRPR